MCSLSLQPEWSIPAGADGRVVCAAVRQQTSSKNEHGKQTMNPIVNNPDLVVQDALRGQMKPQRNLVDNSGHRQPR
jgi:hypothetical protein